MKTKENSEILNIYTENVEIDLWQMLLNFTYQNNIKYYCKQNNIEYNEALGTKIITGINQAKEYFDASKIVSLYTSPLLLYYGATNLFYSISLLKSGSDFKIDNHGMNLLFESENDKMEYIGDIRFSVNDSKKGGFYIFFKNFCGNFENIPPSIWTVKDILSSIPEFKNLFESCYNLDIPHIMPITIYEERDYTLEKIMISDTIRFTDKHEIFKMIKDFDKNYLYPEVGDNVIVLKRKIISNDIGIYSLAGQKYFQLAHLKNDKYVSFPLIIYLLMGLYSLATLSRYQPHVWNEYIKNDVTGEKILVERFINHCRRALPNIFLNVLFKKRIHFSNNTDGIIHSNKEFSDEQIRQIVLGEIKKNKEF